MGGKLLVLGFSAQGSISHNRFLIITISNRKLFKQIGLDMSIKNYVFLKRLNHLLKTS